MTKYFKIGTIGPLKIYASNSGVISNNGEIFSKLELGLILAVNEGYTKLQFDGDSLLVIQC